MSRKVFHRVFALYIFTTRIFFYLQTKYLQINPIKYV